MSALAESDTEFELIDAEPVTSSGSLCARLPVSAKLGRVELRTTVPRAERIDDIAEVLDRRHHAAQRAG